jgi:hypothetical protein
VAGTLGEQYRHPLELERLQQLQLALIVEQQQ